MIATLPVHYNVAAYAATVKPYGFYTQVGMPERFELTMNAIGLSFSRVNFNASLIGDMQETQDVVNYCAEHNVLPQIEVIKAEDVNKAWQNVVEKKARYRYVIDASTI
jgi:D-arabinose 1-dehydrogenase-like Zn-dependent alcohol dehydrogenase